MKTVSEGMKCFGRRVMANLDSFLKSGDITLPTKVHIVKAMVFLSSHIWICELDHKKGWVLKNWSFQTVVLERTLESSLDCKEIQPINPKGNPPWIFILRTGAEAEAPIVWPLDVKSWLIGRDPDAGKDWGQEERGTTEDEMVGWHHWLNRHEVSKLWEMVMDRVAWRAAAHGVAKSLSDWTELNWTC